VLAQNGAGPAPAIAGNEAQKIVGTGKRDGQSFSRSAAKAQAALTSTERSRRHRANKRAAASPAVAAPSVATTAAPNAQRALGVAFVFIAVALAATGVAMTVSYSNTITTGADRMLFAVLAVIADVLALFSPAAALGLWHARRRALAVASWLVWVMAASITLANLSGFVGAHSDSFVAGRESNVIERKLIIERLDRLRAERAEITELRDPAVIAATIRDAPRSKIDDLRTALASARHRDDLDAKPAGLEGTIQALPPTTIADPSASTLAGMVHLVTGVSIATATLQRARSALLLLLPLLAGMLLAIGAALGRRGTP
jgi:hypothetical protein